MSTVINQDYSAYYKVTGQDTSVENEGTIGGNMDLKI